MAAKLIYRNVAAVQPINDVSFSEVAKRHGVHVGTVWRWYLNGVRGHRLESFLVGGKRRTNWDHVEKFLREINSVSDEDDAESVAIDFAKRSKSETSAALAALG